MGRRGSAAAAQPPDPRAPIESNARELEAALADLTEVLAGLEPPSEPRAGDLVDAMLHILFAAGVPCGFGQEAQRRILESHVDLNEFRVTEAFETEALLSDLAIPDLFERCRAAQLAVADAYSDQNAVTLEFLREASVAERKSFFGRSPGITADVARFLNQVMAFEEVLFSPRATQRVQVRLGLDPKSAEHAQFLDQLRELVQPFGHLPLTVGRHGSTSEPILAPALCPACRVIRFAPAGRRH